MAALDPVSQKFILHWGEMGTRWGVNRTVAQVHALLYLSPKPLHAEEIAKTLSVARSNVSSSLRELQSWGIVRVVHVLGDRRDHFESLKDVWEMFRIILEERKRREIDPTLRVLQECVDDMDMRRSETRSSGSNPPAANPTVAYAYTRDRLAALLDFASTMTTFYDEIRALPPTALRGLAKLRGKMRKLLGK
jgi:DNA-binding transcriptional regulator GbsR (MarR family)